jgi:hypothetical protein
MRIAATFVIGFAVLLGFWSVGQAGGDKGKEVTLKGKICCPKCELAIAKKCDTCIVVKEKDKDVIYYFDAAAHKEHHGTICKECKNGSVTGTVSTEGKKKIITVKKVVFE